MNEGNNGFEFLDALTLISFFTQMENLNKDEKYEQFIKKIIIYLIGEIEKLHKENDDIIKKLNIILEKLNEK